MVDEAQPHEHKVIVKCYGNEDRDDLLIYGPFEDATWANGWIEQHNHDPYQDEEGNDRPDEETDQLIMDEDHYCNFFGDGGHEITGSWVPGFDPTTLPKPVTDPHA